MATITGTINVGIEFGITYPSPLTIMTTSAGERTGAVGRRILTQGLPRPRGWPQCRDHGRFCVSLTIQRRG
jgi:hypothetical protein